MKKYNAGFVGARIALSRDNKTALSKYAARPGRRALPAVFICFLFLTGCVNVENFPTPTLPENPSPTVTEPYLPINPSPIDPPVIPSPDFPTPSVSVVTPDWTQNGLTVESLTYQHDFTDGDVVRLPAYGTFPQTGNADIDAYYQRCRDDFERKCGELAEDAGEDAAVYQSTSDYFVECNAGGVLSVSRTVHTNTGGAHGMTVVICETFSADTGLLLTLDDFFSVGRETYTPRLLETVMGLIDANPDLYWGDAKNLAEDFFPYDSFCVTENGVSLLFQEYTLGSYTAGIVRVDVPIEKISDIFILPSKN